MVEKSVVSCKFCGKEFGEIPALKTHEDLHTKEKSYSCNHCDKTFVHQTSFKLHERIHSGMPNMIMNVTSHFRYIVFLSKLQRYDDFFRGPTSVFVTNNRLHQKIVKSLSLFFLFSSFSYVMILILLENFEAI